MNTISCAGCGQQYAVAPHLLGKIVNCPSCGKQLAIPNRPVTGQTNCPNPMDFATMPAASPVPNHLFTGQPRRSAPISSIKLHYVVIGLVIGFIAVVGVLVGFVLIRQEIQRVRGEADAFAAERAKFVDELPKNIAFLDGYQKKLTKKVKKGIEENRERINLQRSKLEEGTEAADLEILMDKTSDVLASNLRKDADQLRGIREAVHKLREDAERYNCLDELNRLSDGTVVKLYLEQEAQKH